ncbi:MAG TPA: OmpA family protein [Alphaproteobacteria bacterium]|nr:OmpA family protein [Alphaproteobacteria bacterium]
MRAATLRLLAAIALAGLVAACSQTPDNLVVLLPEADGSVGSVVVTSTAGTQTLNEAGQATGVDAAGEKPVAPFVLPEEELQKTFGAAIAAQPKLPEVFILYFETGGAVLTPDSAGQLPDVVAAVKARPVPDISVVGHTDRVGTDAVNVPISIERANTVRDLLVKEGIDPAIIEVTSHGEENPLIPTADEVAEPRNRRVEVTVR